MEAVCSVFTLAISGRGVRQGVGLPAAVVTVATPLPPTVWVTGLWGSEVGVSSLWRPWESQLGEETWRCGDIRKDSISCFFHVHLFVCHLFDSMWLGGLMQPLVQGGVGILLLTCVLFCLQLLHFFWPDCFYIIIANRKRLSLTLLTKGWFQALNSRGGTLKGSVISLSAICFHARHNRRQAPLNW